MPKALLKKILEHPLSKGMAVDCPETTSVRRDIITQKKLLNAIYREWYAKLIAALQVKSGSDVLELGSGGGFFSEMLPGCITSEVFSCPGVDLVVDARALPFAPESLNGIVMTDVLHHIPDCRQFFHEALRCLRPGARIAMLEPWNTTWARLIYRSMHSEPFELDASQWELPAGGPLSCANMALPWILFERDKEQFETEFPHLRVCSITIDYPFCYLASGGVSMRSLSPGWTYRPLRGLEKMLTPWMKHWGMFALITLEKKRDA